MHGNTAWMLYLYQKHMKEARGLDVKTIDARMRHLGQFEACLAGKDLVKLKPDDIVQFKESVIGTEQEDGPEAECLAAPTIVQTFHDLRAFIEWLSKQPGYRTLRRDLADYCTPSRRLRALANASKPKRSPSAEEIRATLEAMPISTSTERRDRAVIAFLFLSGVRDGALISLRLKHIDIERKLVIQDATQVNTKFAKTMRTFWFPVGKDMESIVIDWIDERRDFGAMDEDPLFPRTPNFIRFPFSVGGEEFWQTASTVREIIRKATEAADVPYFPPHSVRSTLASMFFMWARNMEDIKALSQNLGHEDLQTTLAHYAELDEDRQHDLIREMHDRGDRSEDDDLIDLIRQVSPEKRHLLKSLAQALSGNVS